MIRNAVTCAVVMTSLVACAGEEGPEGPMGAMGTMGAMGEQGSQGPAGAPDPTMAIVNGTTAQPANFNITGVGVIGNAARVGPGPAITGSTLPVQFQVTSSTDSQVSIATANDLTNRFSYLFFDRARGNVTTQANVAASDEIFRIYARAHFGGALRNAARISGFVDGAPTGTNVPGSLSFYTSDTTTADIERMRITAGGQVDVRPGSHLRVYDAGGTRYGRLLHTTAGNLHVDAFGGGLVYLNWYGGVNGTVIGNGAGGYGRLDTGGVTSTGRVTVTGGQDIRFYDANGGRYGSMFHSNVGNVHIDSVGGGQIYLNWYGGTDGTNIGNGASGYGTITAAAFSAASSSRLKHDIKDLGYGLAEVLRLTPKSFVYNNDPTKRREVGFMAEDVNAILPEVVARDAKGAPSGIDYSKLSRVLVSAIHEQQEEIRTLRRDNKQLAERLERLEKRAAPVRKP